MGGKHSATTTEAEWPVASLSRKKTKAMITAIIVILILLLSFIGIYFYKQFFYSNNGVVPPVSQNEENKNEIDGYKILGRIEIEKINVNQYILEKSTEDSLEIATAKLYGPEINQIGNFCIVGHNYKDIFVDLKKLEKEDTFVLYDTKENKIEYEIYDIISVEPDNMHVLSQETNNEKHVTLITCNVGAETRLVIKAKEIEKNDISNEKNTNVIDTENTTNIVVE